MTLAVQVACSGRLELEQTPGRQFRLQKGDPERVFGQVGPDALGPLDQRAMLPGQHLLDADALGICGARQPVAIDVVQSLRVSIAPVFVSKNKRRAVDRFECAPTLTNAGGECGLSRAQSSR